MELLTESALIRPEYKAGEANSTQDRGHFLNIHETRDSRQVGNVKA